MDVFVRREDAWEALEDALRYEPDWAGTLFVASIELDERDVSVTARLTGGVLPQESALNEDSRPALVDRRLAFELVPPVAAVLIQPRTVLADLRALKRALL